jgi:hypothetical protein
MVAMLVGFWKDKATKSNGRRDLGKYRGTEGKGGRRIE